ncbi:hypothetical protein OPV22_033124 [Ensete ventricosum]|uniref:Secreted protein n=1 Tax=Ensete ventricosum TaxID=4639 RepID=A0AAV8PTH5_ENSVE|nr:hypothetical protein OPV22_033124 [Ensete ventricosum]
MNTLSFLCVALTSLVATVRDSDGMPSERAEVGSSGYHERLLPSCLLDSPKLCQRTNPFDATKLKISSMVLRVTGEFISREAAATHPKLR